jgi:molybdate transport system substrate-binding protein
MHRCAGIFMATFAISAGCYTPTVHAGEVRLAAAVGVRQILLELGPRFEADTGHKIVSTFEATGILVQQVSTGGIFDVVMVNRSGIENLARANRVIAGSVVDIASSVAAVAVRRGIPKPDIASAEAFKRALLAARSIARPSPAVGGSSGDHITLVAERLGIAAEVNSKSVIATVARPPGRVVADGDAEIALHQMQELMAVPGVEIVGPFPQELQGSFMFSAAVVPGAENNEAANALVAFLRTSRAAEVILAKGMAPAVP